MIPRIYKSIRVWFYALIYAFRKFRRISLMQVFFNYEYRRGLAYFGFLKIDKANVIIDVGANVGNWSAMSESYLKPKKLFMIEPLPELIKQLNLRFNDFYRYTIWQGVFDESEGTKIFNITTSCSSSSILKPFSHISKNISADLTLQKTINVTSSTIDSFCINNNISFIDILKLDIQGAELRVLKGAVNVLPKIQYIILEVSFQEIYEGQVLFCEIHNWLSEREYELCRLFDLNSDKNGRLFQADACYRNKRIRNSNS